MAREKRRPTVKRHKVVYKDNLAEEQTQNPEVIQQSQQNHKQPQQTPQAISQSPVVENGQLDSTVVARNPNVEPAPQPVPQFSQPQPQIFPPVQQIVSPPTPMVSQGGVQTAPIQSQDAKLGIGLQGPAGSTMNTPINFPSKLANIPPRDLSPQKKSKWWIILVVIFIMLAAIGGPLYYLRTKAVKEIAKEEKPSPTQSPISPKPSIASESGSLKTDLSKYKIEILNGSGVKGEASRVKDNLEKEKFVVEDIDNAESSDYEKTVIKAKKDVAKEYLDGLRELLKKTYVLDSNKELKDSESVDVVIIIGISKKP